MIEKTSKINECLVSIDALFAGATPVLGQSTPNQSVENGSNQEKTTKLKSLFGIKEPLEKTTYR